MAVVSMLIRQMKKESMINGASIEKICLQENMELPNCLSSRRSIRDPSRISDERFFPCPKPGFS